MVLNTMEMLFINGIILDCYSVILLIYSIKL